MPAKAKVLLVDNSPVCLDQMALFLKSSKVETLTAELAASAVQLAEEHRPKIIFMSMTLPDRSGIECCWQIKQNPKINRAHVVLLTHGNRKEDLDACLSAKCSAVLNKPLHRRSFLEVGRELLAAIDRREPRIPCRSTVACRSSDANFYGSIEDISAHGLFIGAPQPVALGTLLRISFSLPWHDATLIETDAIVNWINRGDKTKLPSGYGVEFQSLSPRAARRLADFLKHRELRPNPANL